MPTVTRIYTGGHGQPHFDDVDPALGGPAYSGRPVVSAPPKGATENSFYRAQPGASPGRRPAHQRRYVAIASGEVELESGDGA
jgi:hypothetical protein